MRILTVDEHDHVQVPPEKPGYTLRRVWLQKQQEEAYYHGLANEGLWPLCHITFTRPAFLASQWEHTARSTPCSPTPWYKRRDEPTIVFIRIITSACCRSTSRNAIRN